MVHTKNTTKIRRESVDRGKSGKDKILPKAEQAQKKYVVEKEGN